VRLFGFGRCSDFRSRLSRAERLLWRAGDGWAGNRRWLQKYFVKVKPTKVVFTGHSLGGAIAGT
jgi:hypothetical protein